MTAEAHAMRYVSRLSPEGENLRSILVSTRDGLTDNSQKYASGQIEESARYYFKTTIFGLLQIRPARTILVNYRIQSGALPYRFRDGQLEFLLVTSARRKRWIVPKGNIEKGLSEHESARKEAFEEAGVDGEISSVALGSYLNLRSRDSTQVRVYPLLITSVVSDEDWTEREIRKRRWCSADEAIALVEQEQLKQILRYAAEVLNDAAPPAAEA
jgi:8-oxo-dGTP pyrophosphatase MutT (NUDIX family)